MKHITVFVAIVVAVAVTAAPLGTEFTYQGVLSDSGVPASGDFDFRFLLYDAEVGGSQVGSIVYVEDLTVTDGRVTTQIDFGSVFDGTALWLEVGVRDGASGGAYTVLSPRQELTAAPFAQHAATADSATTAGHATTAGSATTAGDAATLGGQSGAYYLTWSNFTGIPGDLADGDDDTLSDLSCGPDEIARWNGSAWNCSSDDDTPYTRTYVVGPVGTTTQNGTALRNAIAAITPPASQEEGVLLKVEPGVYDIGTTGIEIYGWTTLEGTGRNLTTITGAVCDTTVVARAGLVFSDSDYSGLRRMTLVNTCSGTVGTVSMALNVEGNGFEVRDARVEATGTAWRNFAFRVVGSNLSATHTEFGTENAIQRNWAVVSHAEVSLFENVTCEADGGTYAVAFSHSSGGDVQLRSSTLKASSGSSSNFAFMNSWGYDLYIEDVVADAGSEIPAIGVFSEGGSGELVDVRARGNKAIYLLSGGPFALREVIADGGYYGLEVTSTDINVGHSKIEGSINSVLLASGTATLEGVILAGGPVSGSVTCTACMRNGAFIATGCP